MGCPSQLDFGLRKNACFAMIFHLTRLGTACVLLCLRIITHNLTTVHHTRAAATAKTLVIDIGI